MLDFIDGLPVHPLIVHAVVALMPLASVLVLVDAVWPRFRRLVGPLPLIVTVLATLSVPLATSSGENLEAAINASENPLVQQHQALGDLMLYWGIGLVVVSAVLLVLRRRRGADGAAASGVGRGLLVGASVLAVAVSIGTMVHIYRVGDSGARAVWQGVGTSAAP